MTDQRPPASLILATFNVHMGVDGWGRPFDVVGECDALGADILVIQESWEPDDGSPSTAGLVVSSGSRPMPIRTARRPSHGHAVITANGIASAGPPARNSA